MTIRINNREYKTRRTESILDVARRNDIYIPSLCSHPELVPSGSCRLCIVEVEGRKGYPSACTTLAEEEMVVRTDTHVLQEMRRELIQLILSEHTSACLVCDDIEGCTGFQETIRKVGVTTGCRWCPGDKDCELQKIVEYLDIHELTLPGLYRGMPVEKYDPFFDRDYNLCIYCGRCVGICNEYRRSNVLSLRHRGKQTTIGPAYNDTHVDAGCEFCGACVSVCPTGALSEKSRKWWGAPEKTGPSVCPLCSLNCDLRVITLKNRIVGTLPPGKSHESGGELCVKGRFCLSEIVNRTERLLEPVMLYPEGYGIVNWDDALEKAREIIRSTPRGRCAVFLSPYLTLEEISPACHFAEKMLGTDWISSSCMDNHLPYYLDLAKDAVDTGEIGHAGVIVSFFLNGNYNYAPLTMAVKSASDEGSDYFQIGWIKDTTTRFARQSIIPEPGRETELPDLIISGLKNNKKSSRGINDLVRSLKNGKENLVIVGPEIMSLGHFHELLQGIREIIRLTGAKLVMPNQYGNLYGLLSQVKLKTLEETGRRIMDGGVDLVWFIGDAPYKERPPVKHLIYQDAFPAPPGLRPDLILPASAWGETGGSYMGSKGTVKKYDALSVPHRYELPHREIFTRLSSSLEPGEALPDPVVSPAFEPELPGRHIHAGTPAGKSGSNPAGGYTHILFQEKNQHTYFTLNLGEGIEGFGELVRPGKVMMNPADALPLGINHGDRVRLTAAGVKKTFSVFLGKNTVKGVLYLVTEDGEMEFTDNPCRVKISKADV